MKVSLFIPCLVDNLAPEIGESTARVLSRLGLDLEYPPDQTCCGQPAFNSGYWEDARKVARQFLLAFGDSEVIVSPSGSCVSMVKNHFQSLFAEAPRDLERATEIGKRTFELCDFLVNRLGVDDVGAEFSGKVTYHDSCHLNRELGIKDEPRKLLRGIKGLELIEMPDSDRCCGFGGTFSIKFPEVSSAMARRKAESIKASGADTVVMCDPGCLIQLSGYMQREKVNVRAMHIASILAEK